MWRWSEKEGAILGETLNIWPQDITNDTFTCHAINLTVSDEKTVSPEQNASGGVVYEDVLSNLTPLCCESPSFSQGWTQPC